LLFFLILFENRSKISKKFKKMFEKHDNSQQNAIVYKQW